MGTNVSTNYITAPADPKETLGIKLPFLVMIIKNVNIILSQTIIALFKFIPHYQIMIVLLFSLFSLQQELRQKIGVIFIFKTSKNMSDNNIFKKELIKFKTWNYKIVEEVLHIWSLSIRW